MCQSLVSTGLEQLDTLLKDGFPDQSSILLVGPPGIGKEAICYWYLHSSLIQGDVVVIVSRSAVRDVIEDARGYGVKLEGPVIWVDCSGLPPIAPAIISNLNDLTGLSVDLKKVASENATRRIRIVMDILSPILLLNPLENMYRFINSLLIELKKYDSVTVATLEEGMHDAKAVIAFEQLFDGVIEMRLYEEGLKVLPLLRVKKMRGSPVQPSFYNFGFSLGRRMEISAYAH